MNLFFLPSFLPSLKSGLVTTFSLKDTQIFLCFWCITWQSGSLGSSEPPLLHSFAINHEVHIVEKYMEKLPSYSRQFEMRSEAVSARHKGGARVFHSSLLQQ